MCYSIRSIPRNRGTRRHQSTPKISSRLERTDRTEIKHFTFSMMTYFEITFQQCKNVLQIINQIVFYYRNCTEDVSIVVKTEGRQVEMEYNSIWADP